MSTDPLDCRQLALFAQVEYTVSTVRHQEWHWPALAATGMDPKAFVEALDVLSQRARRERSEARGKAGDLRVAAMHCENALKAVAAWQKRVRAWLKVAPTDPVATRAVKDVRDAIRGRVLRFAASVRLARAGIAALEKASPALSATVRVDQLVAEGRTHLAALSAAVDAHGLAMDARKAAVATARVDREAVRQQLRYLRLSWAIAMTASDEPMQPLNYWIARADVASRAWRNRARRRRAEGLPVGHVAGTGSARIPAPTEVPVGPEPGEAG